MVFANCVEIIYCYLYSNRLFNNIANEMVTICRGAFGKE